VPPAARTAGKPIAFAEIHEGVATLPTGYASIVAIYPESRVYQSAPITGLRVALVGETRQNEALFVSIDP
jgi:hypothetical protein